MNRVLACLALLSLTTACGRDLADRGSYFPLAPGLQWTYRVTTEVAGQREETRLEQLNVDVADLDGLPHTVRLTGHGTRYFVRETAQGVFRSAKQTIVDPGPRPDANPRWILRRPFAVGSGWSQETHPYVLRRVQPYEETLAKSVTFKMAYQIAALAETVEVPAGRFEGCMRVDGEALLTLYADGRTGYQDIKINTSEWYAPGIGLVKLVRREPLTGEVFAGGSVTLELEQFDH